MNSREFLGFGSAVDFASASKNAEESPGVYILRIKDGIDFNRISGETDILYIGSTENLKRRFYSYNHPGKSQFTNQKVENFVINFKHPAEFLWRIESDKNAAKVKEYELLARYMKEHHEFPPLNGASIRKLEITLRDENINLRDHLSTD